MFEHIGTLLVEPAVDHLERLAAPVRRAVGDGLVPGPLGVVAIDPELADTAAFCERYGVSPDESANCVVVAARRDGQTRYAACVVLATTRADVNGLVRRHLGARKVSFAPMEAAVAETGMAFGAITPIGLPGDWPVLVDAAVAQHRRVVVGSGLRGSKLVVAGATLAALPGAEVLEGLGR
ncbi:MAG: YbaK/EbsC family protein [Acidimicrobiales bacterium]